MSNKYGTVQAEPTTETGGASFSYFAETCARICAESSKLSKTQILADYLRSLSPDEIGHAANWFTGRPFSASQNRVLQVGWALLRDGLCAVAGAGEAAFHDVYLKHSDVGETAAELLSSRNVLPTLTVQHVADVFGRLQAARGPRAKLPVLIAALEHCTALEAKYVVKILTGDLRIGLKEGLVEEALAKAFAQSPEQIRQANLVLGDVGATARLAAENRLAEAALAPFRPVKFMLASPEPNATEVWERVQSRGTSAAVWLEDKYDGVRCQLHKVGNRVVLYSRDLKQITATFFELADAARRLARDFILDGEIVAMRGEQVLPFAELQKRLGRRGDDFFLAHEVPTQFVAFDLLWLDGQSLLAKPLSERRQALETLAPFAAGLRLARITSAGSATEIETAFDAARARGNEGLMIKDPASLYAPGRRGLAWLKLKKALATLDCVVVGVEYGHGKRNRVLSDYTFAVRDEATGELKTIGKAYTGLTDAEIAERTEYFLKTATGRYGRFFEVPPDTVVEIAFDKIAASTRHSSGLALRFPRIVRIRWDKSPAEIDTLETARQLAATGNRLGKQESRKC